MRSCDETLELLSAALDCALNDDEQAALDEHLAHCPACSALFEELRVLQEAAADLEEIPAPADFASRVMGAIAADPAQEQPDNVIAFPTKKISRIHWKRWAASAAVVAVVALGAVALPGQMKSASNCTADMAAPEMAYTNDSAQAQMSEALFDVADGSAEAEDSIARVTSGGAETGVFNHSFTEIVESQEAANAPSASAAPTAAFCGVLTLTAGNLPDGLNAYECTQDRQGNLTYTVPADFFFDVAQTLCSDALEKFKVSLDQGGYDPDAEYGLIIVESLS